MGLIRELQERQKPWVIRNFGGRSRLYPVLGVAEEAGELSHHVLKMEQNIRGTKEEHLAGIRDSLADVIIFCLDVATAYEIDLEDALIEVFEEVMQRDWVKHREEAEK